MSLCNQNFVLLSLSFNSTLYTHITFLEAKNIFSDIWPFDIDIQMTLTSYFNFNTSHFVVEFNTLQDTFP